MAGQPLSDGAAAMLDAEGRTTTAGEPPLVHLRLLDGFSIEHGGDESHIPHSVRRLVAFLGVRGRCGRAEIVGTLWPDVPEAKAQARLRTVLWRLRRLTERPFVIGGESLSLSDDVSVDVRTFVTTARQVLNDGDGAPDRSALRDLTIMGELLPGWCEDWVLFERERLRQLRLHALEAITRRLITVKRYSEAIEAAMMAVRLEPLRESATRALIVAHLAENNVVEAVRQFKSFRDGLTSELGLEPTPDLKRLVQSGLDRQV